MSVTGKKLEILFEAFDQARNDSKAADEAKKDLSEKIKEALGDTEEVDSPNFITTYRFDKDRETEAFDEEKFAAKDPKKYKQYLEYVEDIKTITKKYTKTVVTKGARKLYVTRKEQE